MCLDGRAYRLGYCDGSCVECQHNPHRWETKNIIEGKNGAD